MLIKKSVWRPINSLFIKLDNLPKNIPIGAQILSKSDNKKIGIEFFLENMRVVRITPIRAPWKDMPPSQTLNIFKGWSM